MKKRWLSLLLAVCVMVSSVPVTSLAAEWEPSAGTQTAEDAVQQEALLEDASETRVTEELAALGTDELSKGMILDADYAVEGGVQLESGTLDLYGHTLRIRGNL